MNDGGGNTGRLPVEPASETETVGTGTSPDPARHRDDQIVKAIALVIIGAVITYTVVNSAAAASAIDVFRTWATRYFSWYFVTLATIALVFCLWMAFSKRGHTIFGGVHAEREYGNFAWYSMLFACGQGVGLIFWSVAEPVLVLNDNPLAEEMLGSSREQALVWTFFHWSVHAWAIYCLVALCLALSFHNRNEPMTFRDAVVGILPAGARRPAGLVIEVVAILATVFGLSTSFAFAAMQITSGLEATFGLEGNMTLRTIVIVGMGVVSAVSVYIGVDKGMKRISETNSILSILLLLLTLVFGPTLYILTVMPEVIGQYVAQLMPMGLWAEADTGTETLVNWSDSWLGNWTVFIWAWCWAFSPFVGSFIARISRGRTVREFVIGVLVAPALICTVWITILGSTALEYDDRSGGAVTDAVQADVSMGLFAALEQLPIVPIAFVALVIATVLVGTYFITSLDSGAHALAGFAASAAKPSPLFRAGLVVGIGGIAFLLLSIGGEGAVGTVQTGTLLGALPYTVVVMLMMVQAAKHSDNPSVLPERQVASRFPASVSHDAATGHAQRNIDNFPTTDRSDVSRTQNETE